MAQEPSLTDLIPGGAFTVAGFFIFLLVLVPVGMSYHEVQTGHRAVEYQQSALTGDVHKPGPAFTIPAIQSVQQISVRPQTYTMSHTQGEGKKGKRNDAITFKADGSIPGRADITVRYELKENSKSIESFVREWHTLEEAERKLIRPTVRSTVRDEAAGIKPDVVMSERGRRALEQAVRKDLKKQFSSEALKLEAVQVRDVTITDGAYMQSLREKKRAKKQVEVEEIQIKKQKKVAKQKKVDARADAKVIRIKGEALRNNPTVLKLRYIKALKKSNTVYVPTNSGSLTLTKEVADPKTNNSTATLGGA